MADFLLDLLPSLLEWCFRLVMGCLRAAWWVVRTVLTLIGQAMQLIGKLIGTLAAAAVTSLWLLLQPRPDGRPGSRDLRTQALRLGLEPRSDGTATALRGGVALCLRVTERGWRMEAQAMHGPPVAVTSTALSVPPTMEGTAVALAQEAKSPTEVDLG